jgi:hypothetical protein
MRAAKRFARTKAVEFADVKRFESGVVLLTYLPAT